MAPIPASTGGFATTNSHITPPGTAYARTEAEAPANATGFANAPIASIPAPTGGQIFTSTSPRLELPTPPLVLGPWQLLQAFPKRRSHRSRRLREVLQLLTPTSPRLELPTPPLMLRPRQLLQALPTRQWHRSRCLWEGLHLLNPVSPSQGLPTPPLDTSATPLSRAP